MYGVSQNRPCGVGLRWEFSTICLCRYVKSSSLFSSFSLNSPFWFLFTFSKRTISLLLWGQLGFHIFLKLLLFNDIYGTETNTLSETSQIKIPWQYKYGIRRYFMHFLSFWFLSPNNTQILISVDCLQIIWLFMDILNSFVPYYTNEVFYLWKYCPISLSQHLYYQRLCLDELYFPDELYV